MDTKICIPTFLLHLSTRTRQTLTWTHIRRNWKYDTTGIVLYYKPYRWLMETGCVVCVSSQTYIQSSAFLVVSPVRYSETIFHPQTLFVLAEEYISNISHEVPAREVMDVKRKLHYIIRMRNLYPTEMPPGQVLVQKASHLDNLPTLNRACPTS